MIRTVIQIDEEKCNGCGLCANACHEGAIEIIGGKAKLTRDDYCDGFGDCLPSCPTGAITFIEREAAAYDEAAVKANMERKQSMLNAANGNIEGGRATSPAAHEHAPHAGGCPGSAIRSFDRGRSTTPAPSATEVGAPAQAQEAQVPVASSPKPSELGNWPVQIKLAPTQAPYFHGANLLIAADCCAYAYGNFHAEFMRNKVALIGCPKLDAVDYADKLTRIIANNDVKSVTITRMEVPCCGGLENAAINALKASGRFIPWQVVTFSLDGHILD
jgi:NAD-dependent dihydropyrimidine dehydrogenase PreA subunit